MRILHIVRQFSPAIGGLENFVLCLARAQIQAGHHPEVLTLDTLFHQDGSRLPAQETIEGIPVHRIPWRGSYKYPLATAAISQVKGFDIIHVHAVDFFADFLPLLRPFHRTPLVLSTHGGFFHSSYASFLKRIFFNTATRLSLRGYKRVFACSVGDLRMFAPLCLPWLQLIENGVDIEKFANLGPLIFSNTFLFIGRFSENKRLDLLLQTIHRLKHWTPDVRLTIIGRDWDGNLARLREQIDTLELHDQVEIRLDLDDYDIKMEIARHCFVISASDYEGFGMTMVEGMSAGLVPIASPIASFKRIIEEAGVGHLVDFHDPDAAARSILAYTQGIAARYHLVRKAATLASTRYGWPETAARFIRVYEEILGSRTRVIQGVAIDTRSGGDVIQAIDRTIAQRTPLRIAIANAHTINLAREAPDYRHLLRDFMVLNDGAGVNLASRWKYRKPFCENLNGTDFVPRLLAESTRSLRIFLVGARPWTVDEACRRLSRRYPRHRWMGYQHGYYGPADEETVCARIRATSPDLLLVALGNPLQEEWIARCAEKTGATVCIGVGAFFDFVAGQVPRAPLWIRQLKCEWIYRLLQEPRRLWRRYLIGNLVFLWAARGDQV